jgi:hypothetical protein
VDKGVVTTSQSLLQQDLDFVYPHFVFLVAMVGKPGMAANTKDRDNFEETKYQSSKRLEGFMSKIRC